MPKTQWFRARARNLYHIEGEIEIDENARVSLGGPEGAYVQAWVWVPSEHTQRGTFAGRHESGSADVTGTRTLSCIQGRPRKRFSQETQRTRAIHC
jgi:hypothetical protein